MTGDHRSRARAATMRARGAIADVPRPLWIVAALIAAALIVVIAAGGLAAARADVVRVGQGDEIRTATYAITVLDTRLAQTVESEGLDAEPGETLVVMRATIENLSKTPIGVGSTADLTKANLINTDRPLLDLVGAVPTGASTAVWRADGSAGQVFLQPEVPAEVMIAWTVSTESVADDLSLEVHEAEVSVGAVLLSSHVVTWNAGEVAASVTLPVRSAT